MAITARYWGIQASNTSLGGFFAMSTLKLKDTIGGTDRAQGGAAIASAFHSAPYAPSMAFDGNNSTFWTSGGVSPPAGGHWIIVDLGADYTIAEVEIVSRSDGVREDPIDFELFWCTDLDYNTRWPDTYYVFPTQPAWTAGETRTFAALPLPL